MVKILFYLCGLYLFVFHGYIFLSITLIGLSYVFITIILLRNFNQNQKRIKGHWWYDLDKNPFTFWVWSLGQDEVEPQLNSDKEIHNKESIDAMEMYSVTEDELYIISDKDLKNKRNNLSKKYHPDVGGSHDEQLLVLQYYELIVLMRRNQK